MTLSPELLAMIADVPAATDEQIRGLLKQCEDWSVVSMTREHAYALISRIVADQYSEQELRLEIDREWRAKLDHVKAERDAEKKVRDAYHNVALSAKEFIDDWTKGDFSLSTLAALDAQSLDDRLTELSAALSALEE